MASTDTFAATLVEFMDKAFNNKEAPPVGGLGGLCQLRPGVALPALDNFGECSLVWVMAGTRFMVDSFPTPADFVQCGGRATTEFTLGIARCSTALGEGGQLPTLEDMEAEYARQEDDKDRLEWATCRAKKHLEGTGAALNVALTPVEVYGPEGGTVAVYRSIIIEKGRG